MSFFDNFVKILYSGWSFRKDWFSLFIPKIKLDPPPTREECFGVHILGLHYINTFFQNWKFCQKINFVSNSWKIIIPLGIVWGTPHGLYKCICVGNDFLFTPKCLFWQFYEKKNLTAAGVLGKYIWFSLFIPKIKFDPPPQGKNDLVFIF